MAAISETLRQARLRSGVDLDRLAAKTKINPRYLQAIEAGEFEKLPGGIFARMFIKQYADAVGLDGASFADEFQRIAPSAGYAAAADVKKLVETRADFQPRVPGFASGPDRAMNDRMTSMLSSLIWVVGAILVCAGAYYGLAHLPGRSSESATQAPAPKSPPVVTSPPVTEPAPGPVASTPSATQAPESTPASTPASTPPGTPQAPPANPNPVPGSQPIQIALSPTEVVWVTAIADGKTVVSEALQPGTQKLIEAAKGARVTLGNAGGMDITFNGKKLEAFGPRGQVRTIDFSSFGAQLVSRTPPPSSAVPPPNPDPLR